MERRHTILVVDDEPDVVQSVKDLLRLDYKVVGTTRPDEALSILEQQPIDVVMTDQRMPEMTGVQFLSRVKGPCPEATRLLFTGYADIRAVIDAINEGHVYRYITKPWDPDELQAIIREACERHDLIVQRRELTDQLEENNAMLQRANAELRNANDLKAAFIQVASHELRTPLSILVGYTELAARTAGGNGQGDDWLRRIRKATERLQHLVEQIISMLESDDFRAKLQRRSTDLAELLGEAAADVEPFVELRRQTLVRDWPDDVGVLDTDRVKMRDCLNHLLLNAIKFTPDGGAITLAARRLGVDDVEISVADTGCGMDDDFLQHYGEAFFTGYNVSHHTSGTFEHGRRGLGLGASVVKRVVELHGGSVRVESRVGQGTKISLTLPRSAATAAEPA